MRVCIREPLTAPRTYYVRTDGSDGNDGLSDSAGGAFRTIQKGIDVASTDIDAAGYSCVIQVRAGTYTESVALKAYLGTAVFVLRGDTTTPSNVLISPSSGAAIRSSYGTIWGVEGFRLTSPDSHGITTAGRVTIQFMDFGDVPIAVEN